MGAAVRALQRRSRALRVLQAGSAAARALPPGLVVPVAEAAAVALSRAPLWPAAIGGAARRRRMVRRHMGRVCGPSVGPYRLSLMADESFASYARYWAESLRLPGLSSAEVRAGIDYEGFGHIREAVAAGRGAILALPHLGGWEWGGTDLALSGYQVTVVVERLEPPEVFEWFASFRRELGMEVVPAGPGAAAACSRALASNRILCLLSDRVVGEGAGVEVEFFGERTSLPAGPAVMALRSGAALLPCAVYFTRPRGHLGVIRPPLELPRAGRFRSDVAAGTALLAAELEALIRRAPTQWHLMQPNWPSDHDGRPAGGSGRPGELR